MYSDDNRFQVVCSLPALVFGLISLDKLLIGRGGVGKSALAIQWVNCKLALIPKSHSSPGGFLRSLCG